MTQTRRSISRSGQALAGLILAALLAMAALVFVLLGQHEQQSTAEAAIGGPFVLVDSTGQVVTDRNFLGRYMLVYFGYTYCPDICPTTLSTVTHALALLGRSGDTIQPIFITVDPQRDKPDVMGHYTAAFSPRLIGLTGSPAQIAAAETAYHVTATPGANSATSLEAIDHSAVLYLMGPDGRFIAPLPVTGTASALAGDLARLIHRG